MPDYKIACHSLISQTVHYASDQEHVAAICLVNDSSIGFIGDSPFPRHNQNVNKINIPPAAARILLQIVNTSLYITLVTDLWIS